MTGIEWQHAKPDDTHPVDPHHTATGHWVCYRCRAEVNDAGRKVNMTALRTPATTEDPDRPGLHKEGS